MEESIFKTKKCVRSNVIKDVEEVSLNFFYGVKSFISGLFLWELISSE